MLTSNNKKNYLRFLKWYNKTYAKSSQQVGTDADINSGQGVQRTFSLSDADSIHVSILTGSASGTGTQADPVRTLDQAIALVTNTKHKIVILDSETYEGLSESIHGTEYFDANGIFRYHPLSGIYSKAGETPTIKNTTLKNEDLGTIPINYNFEYYNNRIYYVDAGNVKEYDPYLNTVTSLYSAIPVVYLTIKDNTLLSLDRTNRQVSQYTIGTGNTNVAITGASTSNTFISRYLGNGDMYIAEYTGTAPSITWKFYKASSLGSAFTAITGTTTTLSESEPIKDFIFYEDWFYVSTDNKIVAFKLDSSQGIVVNSDILIKDGWVNGNSTITDFKVTSKGNLYIARSDGTYKLKNGIATQVTNKILTCIEEIDTGMFVNYLINDNYNSGSKFEFLDSYNFELISAGIQESGIMNNYQLFRFNNGNLYISDDQTAKLYRYKFSSIDLLTHTSNQHRSEAKLVIHSDHANTDTNFADDTGNHTVTQGGTAQHSTTQKKFGNTSMYFNGTTDYLDITGNLSDFDIASGVDFCFECWLYDSSITTETLFSFVNASSDEFTVRTLAGGNIQVILGSTQTQWSPSLAASTWYHIAVTRQSNYLFVYVDGVQYTPSFGSSYNNAGVTSVTTVNVGRSTDGTYYYQNAYLDEIRWCKGNSIYSQYDPDFVPPKTFFPWGSSSNTYIEGTFYTEGVKYENVFDETFLSSKHSTQKILPKFINVNGFYRTFQAARLELRNSIYEDTTYLIDSKDSYYYDSINYIHIVMYYNLILNATYINVEDISGTYKYLYWYYNTFDYFGKFLNFDMGSNSISIIANVMTNPVFEDYGTVIADLISSTNNFIDTNWYIDDGGSITDLYDSTQHAIQYKNVYDKNYMLRSYQEGYLLYNAAAIAASVGAYYQQFPSFGSSDMKNYWIPKPSNIQYRRGFHRKIVKTSKDGEIYREVNTPTIDIQLTWDSDYSFTYDEVESLINIMGNAGHNDWWEVFLYGILDTSSWTWDLPNGKVTLPNTIQRHMEWLYRVLRKTQAGNENIHIVKSISPKGNILYFDTYDEDDFKYYTDPHSVNNEARGFICKIEPSDIAADTRFVDDSLNPNCYRSYSGISMVLKLCLTQDFEGN